MSVCIVCQQCATHGVCTVELAAANGAEPVAFRPIADPSAVLSHSHVWCIYGYVVVHVGVSVYAFGLNVYVYAHACVRP